MIRKHLSCGCDTNLKSLVSDGVTLGGCSQLKRFLECSPPLVYCFFCKIDIGYGIWDSGLHHACSDPIPFPDHGYAFAAIP